MLATRGTDGLVITDSAETHRIAVPRLVDGNPTGAGDAAAAAVSHALCLGFDLVTAACDAVALSATAVAAPVAGVVDIELYRELRARVVPERVEGT